MKTIRIVPFIILLALFATACQLRNPLVPEPGVESMKGFELYSWEKNGQSRFSILIGTNRKKTPEEIQSRDATLHGIEELKISLETIPAGEYVTWQVRNSLAFPPEDIIQQVMEICKEHGLELSIAK
jgi:hypothetical protein